MADTAKRLVGPVALSSSNTALYIVPGATTAIVRNIHLANYTTSTLTFTLAVGTTATTSNSLYYNYQLPGNTAFDWSGFLVLAAGENLSGAASGGGAISVTVSGVEVS